jgi:tetratricopeptide (TPR) repeat protein
MEQAFEAAAITLGELLRLDKRNVTALKLRGDVLYLLGQEKEAEQSLLAAIEQEPRNPEPHYAVGRIYYQQNRFQDAIREFATVVELDPGSYRAHDNMGLSYEGLNDTARALQHYEKALALVHRAHPGYDWVYGNMSNLMYKLGDYRKAFQFGAEAANRNPGSWRNYYLTGRALDKLGKPELAAKWLGQAVALDGSLSEAHYVYAQVLRKLGRKEDAQRELEIFRELKAKEPQKRK